ncbi:MAG: hypothetical protein J1E16_12155 [Muribaculaceae bacterium]|nr:hypothetical protein [Muribaculaceae bacterium]
MNHTELIPFFKERLLELLNRESLDSYRVRYHNSMSILNELKELIEGWCSNTIKHAQTLEYCIDETLNLIDPTKDKIIDFSACSFQRFKTYLTDYKNNITQQEKDKKRFNNWESVKLIYIINSILKTNEDVYLDRLWDAIENTIFADTEFSDENFIPVVSELDILIVALAREILNSGFSKSYAFKIIKNYNKKDDSKEEFLKFKSFFNTSITNSYKVIFSLYINNASDYELPNFKEELDTDILPDELKENARYENFISSSSNKRLYVVEVESSDTVSAIKEAKSKLLGELDAIHIGMSSLQVKINDRALIIELKSDSNNKAYFHPVKYTLDGQTRQNKDISDQYRTLLSKIKQNPNIDKSAKLRLDSALRHLRIANSDVEIEQRFINYWIGLEFIFSSPLIEENTYNRLKNNLINILSVCYVERNLNDLEIILRKRSILNEEENIESKEKIDNICSTLTNILLKYRLKKFKSILFSNSERRKDYIKSHRYNLECHLSRIYHLRNELIHEAAIKQDIEDLTSNLKYYLTFILNQMIYFFASWPDKKNNYLINIDHFFYEYQRLFDNIEDNYSLKEMRKVPYQKNIIIK